MNAKNKLKVVELFFETLYWDEHHGIDHDIFDSVKDKNMSLKIDIQNKRIVIPEYMIESIITLWPTQSNEKEIKSFISEVEKDLYAFLAERKSMTRAVNKIFLDTIQTRFDQLKGEAAEKTFSQKEVEDTINIIEKYTELTKEFREFLTSKEFNESSAGSFMFFEKIMLASNLPQKERKMLYKMFEIKFNEKEFFEKLFSKYKKVLSHEVHEEEIRKKIEKDLRLQQAAKMLNKSIEELKKEI